ncbi:MAG: hypothetical protein JW902_09380 [Syntrophaceae bacterium]|nr:hypothetical protein [Syntrophaceae bacterium]
MGDTIGFGQMLAEMDRFDRYGKPVPFSIAFVAADRKRNTGGDYHIIGEKTLFNDLLCRRVKDHVFTESMVIKAIGKHKGEPILAKPKRDPAKAGCNPRHYKNGTMNVMILSSRQIRKVHLRLIRYFNDKQVIP